MMTLLEVETGRILLRHIYISAFRIRVVIYIAINSNKLYISSEVNNHARKRIIAYNSCTTRNSQYCYIINEILALELSIANALTLMGLFLIQAFILSHTYIVILTVSITVFLLYVIGFLESFIMCFF